MLGITNNLELIYSIYQDMHVIMEKQCYFIKGIWAPTDFGIHGNPATNPHNYRGMSVIIIHLYFYFVNFEFLSLVPKCSRSHYSAQETNITHYEISWMGKSVNGYKF